MELEQYASAVQTPDFKVFRMLLENNEKVKMPVYASQQASCMDFHAANLVPQEIKPGETVMIPLGIKVSMNPGWELELRPRSGLAAKFQVTLMNSPGTIDSDFRGQVCALVKNTGSSAFVVEFNDRICQGKINLAPQYLINEASSEDELGQTERGAGGFGSTGKNG